MALNDYNPFSLSGKTVVITGASSGIGQRCAIDCSRMGACVVLVARNVERLAETLSMMKGVGHLSFSQDLSDFDSLPDLANRIVAEVGKIDGLLNCAGISTTLPFKQTSAEKLKTFAYTNIFASILLTKELTSIKRMNPGGSVVFFSSIMGMVGEPGKTLYSMTKGALLAAVRPMACELAKRRIRVNCISPGAVLTPINEHLPHMADPAARAILDSKHLLGLGSTEDVAGGCLFLLSDASRWMTGQNLVIDGGYTCV